VSVIFTTQNLFPQKKGNHGRDIAVNTTNFFILRNPGNFKPCNLKTFLCKNFVSGEMEPLNNLSRKLTSQTHLFAKMLEWIKQNSKDNNQYLFVDNHPASKLESMGLKYLINIFPEKQKGGTIKAATPIFLIPDKSEFWNYD
jgi:hypothetical protein